MTPSWLYNEGDAANEWRSKAACLGTATNMFPELHMQRAVNKAKEVCSACPVTSECEEGRGPFAYGVWGGEFWYDGDKITDEEVEGYAAKHRERARRSYHKRKEEKDASKDQ